MTSFNPNDFVGGLQQAVDNYDGNAPAVLLQVYRNGVSAKAATGTTGIGNDTPATNDDKFEIGSQTKMMTATVLLQLVSEGKFSLDDKLADVMDVSHLSGIANIEQATLRQLMTHTSGIPDFLNDFINEDGIPSVALPLLQDPPQPIGVDHYLNFLNSANAPAKFEPGAGNSYSNTGFLLLGLAIENVTGNTLADEFQTRIFDPVGMTSTSAPGFGRPDDILSSYTELDGQLVDVTRLPIQEMGESGVVSTTGDMIRFMKALALDKTLVPADQMDALAQFFGVTNLDTEIIGHSGGTFGTSTVTFIDLKTGMIISGAETARSSTADFLDNDIESVAVAALQNPAWFSVGNGNGDIDFTVTAADMNITETLGTDGAVDTLLTMGRVSLAIDGKIGDLNTDRFTFKDNSTLFIADESGSRFSIRSDAFDARSADNQLIGLGGKDVLIGGYGDDKISGGAGNDRLFGRSGDDRISGGDGNDRLGGNTGNDHLDGGNGNDRIRGGNGDDHILGGAGDDALKGDRGNDILVGGAGDDELIGGRGKDTLDGGTGDDLLYAGAGADTFVFAENSGQDVILGFQGGEDKIDLSALNLTFDDLTIKQAWCGLETTVSFGNAEISVVGGSAQLTADDFIF